MFGLLDSEENVEYVGVKHLKVETLYTLTESAFSRLIREHVKPGHYSLYDSANDTTHRMTVSGTASASTAEALAELLDDSEISIYKLRDVLDELCSRKIIPPGTYLMEVSW